MENYGGFRLFLDVAYEKPMTFSEAVRLGKAKQRRNKRSYARRSMQEEVKTKRF